MAYIDDRIAELEQRIAEKKAYQRMHSPHKYASTWDYVAEGDRSGFDRIDAEEAAYRNMLAQQAQQNAILKAQQEFNARENELNRKNALRLADKANSTNRSNDDLTQKEYEFALIEHDAAKEKMDKDDPDAIANFKRTANKVNYWGKHLPAGMNFEPIVIPEVFEDSKSVRINKKVKTAKNLMARQGKNWRDEDVVAVETLIRDPELPDELVVQLSAELANKGAGAETKAANWRKTKETWRAEYNKLTPAGQRQWKIKYPKRAQAIGV